MIKLIKSFKLLTGLIFFLISVFIVGTWFKGNTLYGGAEVGLFAYNSERWLEISKYIWWSAVAPGQLIPHFITSVPLYFSFYLLNLFGLSTQNIQLIFFFVILFLMGYGVFLLSLHFLEDSDKKYALFAGLFYIFNAYILVQVWHRFLYSTLILAAVLPLLILFWRKWIKDSKLIYLNIFLLINFLSSYMYGNLASIITIWIALFLVSLAELVFPWQGKFYATKIGSKFLLGFILWLLTNVWWITPTFSIAPGLLSTQHSGEDNLSTLIVISRQTIMPYLLQLTNPFYLFYRQELGTIYSNVLFKLIPWIMSAVILIGLITSLKIKRYAKYSVIFIILLLLAKGAAIPFAYPYIFLFKHFYFLGVIRNPFEKLGIMLPLFGAMLFAIGLRAFFKWGNRHLGHFMTKSLMIFVLITLFGYAWPMFGGTVFGNKELPVKVEIPKSYMQADEWLKQKKENQGVILHLPFSGRDVVTYQWENGYHGVDQNEILFTSLPSLSRTIGIERVDNTLKSLTYIFHPPFSEDKRLILNTLQTFNIRYIVLHKDIKWNDKDTYGEIGNLLEPNSIEKVLDNLDFLKKMDQFGQLIIYQLNDAEFRPILSFIDNFQIVYPGESDIMQVLSKTKGYGDILTSVSDEIDNMLSQKSSQTLIFPDKKIEYFESSPSAIIAGANDLFNKLLQVNAYFASFGDLPSEEIAKKLIFATVKVTQLASSQKFIEYQDSIKTLFKTYSPDLNIHRLFRSLIADTLRLHLLILSQIGNTSDSTKIIEDNMVRFNMLPEFRTYGQIFKFKVPADGNYELLLDSQAKDSNIRINGASINSKNNVVSHRGNFEISYSSSNDTLNEDLVLRATGSDESVPGGEILSLNEESPVSFSGKIRLIKPAFLNFAQTFHPEWILILNNGDVKYEVKNHFLGNLYGNTWFVDKIGDYDFKIEFTPQSSVKSGMIVTIGVSVLLLIINFYTLGRRLIKR